MSRQMAFGRIVLRGSTGTNVAAALRVAREAGDDACRVIVCDTGEHYLSTPPFRRL